MKPTLLQIFAVAFFQIPCALFADTDADCKKIAEIYRQIEKATEHGDSIKLNRPDEQGYSEIEVWNQEPGHLIKLVSTFNESHGGSRKECYLNEGKLIFLLEVVESTPMKENASTTIRETRYYFKDGNLIRKLFREGKQTAKSKSDISKAKQTEQELEGADWKSLDEWCNKTGAILNKIEIPREPEL